MDQDHHIRVWAGRYLTEVIDRYIQKGRAAEATRPFLLLNY
jgi:hypothetical protein